VVAVASVVVFRYLPSDRANAEVVGAERAADPTLVGAGAD
jgi:hypothetical protein